MKKLYEEPSFTQTDNQEFSSADTALANSARAKKGFTPALYKDKHTNFVNGGINLDYGCGTPETSQVVTDYLNSLGVTNIPYDREYFPDTTVFDDYEFDTVTASNLLNVVPENVQLEIIQNCYDALKPGGVFYATVGYVKDYVINADGKKVPSCQGRRVGVDSYQQSDTVNKYVDRVKQIFGDDYVNSYGGLIVATKE